VKSFVIQNPNGRKNAPVTYRKKNSGPLEQDSERMGTMGISRGYRLDPKPGRRGHSGSLAVENIGCSSCRFIDGVSAATSVKIPFVTGDGRQRDTTNQLGMDVIWVG
jgi:hypothetical protein